MCTAIALCAPRRCFGRNLDLEYSMGEGLVLCPRRFPLPFRHLPEMAQHAAFLGMACVKDGFPLYFDAVSEHGLCMAALNFPHFCAYHAAKEDAVNVASFELIAYVLASCRTFSQARTLLSRIRLTDDAFSPALPPSPLHYMLSDGEHSLVIESCADGLHLYDNPSHVMTNSPPFPYHMQRLSDFMGVTREEPRCRFGGDLPLLAYSRAMGAMGLPGDLSSSSRFVRAAFARANSDAGEQTDAAVQLFHLLDFVAFPRGLARLEDGRFEYTLYACCMDAAAGAYYYKKYESCKVLRAAISGKDAQRSVLIHPRAQPVQ